jgi:CRP-like cAMP-binding protein
MNRYDTALVCKAQGGPERHSEVARRAPAANRKAANKASIGNSLLGALPHAVYRRLLAAGLAPVVLKFGEVLHEPEVPIPYVYFPIDCVISLLASVHGHLALKVGLVGHEGMVGSPLALGNYASPRRAVVQGTGTAMRMASAPFRKQILQSKPLQKVMYRWVHALIGQMSQSAVCNQFHALQGRLALYLSMIGERASSREIHLTHEFLARALGARRVGVTVAANTLQKHNLIKCSRGKITILDRKRLGAAACHCYAIIKRI